MDDAPRRRPGSSTGPRARRRPAGAGRPRGRRSGSTTALGVDVVVVGALADGHGHPAPVRVGAVHRRLHQRRVHDRLADPLGLDVVAGAVDLHLDQRRGALAVARRSGGSARAPPRPAPARSSSRSTGPAAPLAMIAAVSLVEVSVSMLSALSVRSMTRRNTASSSLRVDVGVGAEQGDQRRHVGLDHARHPWPRRRWSRRPHEADATLATVSVVIMAAADRLGLDAR